MAENEVSIEVSFLKRFNLGNYQHKEYAVKLIGKQSQVEEQLNNEHQRLTNYIAQLENIVEIANDANKLKSRLDVAQAAPVPANPDRQHADAGSQKMQEL
jgi:hypothetical protein